MNIATGPVSGGGTIFHDPATGDYFGALALRLGKLRHAQGVRAGVAPRTATATSSSFIVIGTIEGLGWQLGPVTFDGLGLLFVADRASTRTPSAPRCRPASSSTCCSRPIR